MSPTTYIISIPIDRRFRDRLLKFRDSGAPIDITTLVATLFYYRQVYLHQDTYNDLYYVISEYLYAMADPERLEEVHTVVDIDKQCEWIIDEVTDIYHDYAKHLFDQYVDHIDYWDLTLVSIRVTPLCIVLTCQKRPGSLHDDTNSLVTVWNNTSA